MDYEFKGRLDWVHKNDEERVAKSTLISLYLYQSTQPVMPGGVKAVNDDAPEFHGLTLTLRFLSISMKSFLLKSISPVQIYTLHALAWIILRVINITLNLNNFHCFFALNMLLLSPNQSILLRVLEFNSWWKTSKEIV